MAASQMDDIFADAKLSEKKHLRSSLVMYLVYFLVLATIALALR